MDYAALMGGIGKTVSKLKKHEQGAVKQLADGLVKKWKVVAAAGKPKEAGAGHGKRDRSLMHAATSQNREMPVESGITEGSRLLGMGFGDRDWGASGACVESAPVMALWFQSVSAASGISFLNRKPVPHFPLKSTTKRVLVLDGVWRGLYALRCYVCSNARPCFSKSLDAPAECLKIAAECL